jgi:hypothetical protein
VPAREDPERFQQQAPSNRQRRTMTSVPLIRHMRIRRRLFIP